MKGNRRYIQGYTQAVVNEPQIVLAAEISANAGLLASATDDRGGVSELQAVGPRRQLTVAVADAQYWNEQHMDGITSQHGIQVLIPSDSDKRKGERPGWTGGRYSFMRRVAGALVGSTTGGRTRLPALTRAPSPAAAA